MKWMIALVFALLCAVPFALAEGVPGAATLTLPLLEGGAAPRFGIADPDILACEGIRSADAAAGTVTCAFAGMRPGTTTLSVVFGSGGAEGPSALYRAEVDPALNVTLTPARALERFWYIHGGSMVAQKYEVFTLGGDYYLCKNNDPSQPLDRAVVEALTALIEACDLASWDGFRETAAGVLDGEDFHIEIALSDGTSVNASGSNAFPPGYFRAAGAIRSLLNAALEPEPSEAGGVYRCEGSGGSLTLTLFADGAYAFHEGEADGCTGGGKWYQEGPRLQMIGDDVAAQGQAPENGMLLYNTFISLRDALIFEAEGSSNFPHVVLPDGARLTKTAPAPGKTASLSFHSFDGGGPEYDVTIDDESVLACKRSVRYENWNHAFLKGAGYTVTFTFTGLKPGSTRASVSGWSPAAGGERRIYDATVDERLNVSLTLLAQEDMERFVTPEATLTIEVNGRVFYAHPEDNASATALIGKLNSGGVTVEMRDHGAFEKVGPLPWTLPDGDASIATAPGDVVLYEGNQIAICYDRDTRDLTRLARIGNATREALLDALGDGDVTVAFALEWSE